MQKVTWQTEPSINSDGSNSEVRERSRGVCGWQNGPEGAGGRCSVHISVPPVNSYSTFISHPNLVQQTHGDRRTTKWTLVTPQTTDWEWPGKQKITMKWASFIGAVHIYRSHSEETGEPRVETFIKLDINILPLETSKFWFLSWPGTVKCQKSREPSLQLTGLWGNHKAWNVVISFYIPTCWAVT